MYVTFFCALFIIFVAHIYSLWSFDRLLARVREVAPEAWEAEGKPSAYLSLGFGWQSFFGSMSRGSTSIRWLAGLPDPLPSDPEAMRRLSKYRRAMVALYSLILLMLVGLLLDHILI